MGNLTHTVSGYIASFRSAARVPIESLKCYFKPKQDLHGYDKPWPAGGGKNLFNINAPYAEPSDITSANTTARIFTPGTHFVGIASNNYVNRNSVSAASVSGTTISVTATSGYGYGFALKLIPDETYYLSGTSTSSASFTYYDSNGEVLDYQGARLNKATTIPTGTDITLLTFASSGGNTITWNNILLELGSTATSYEPYENICSIEGWDNCTVYKTGKNIARVVGYSALNTNSFNVSEYKLTNSYGTSINTRDYLFPDTPLVITQTEWSKTDLTLSYYNGYIGVAVDNLIFDKFYDVSFKVTNITNNPLNIAINNLLLLVPSGGTYNNAQIINENTVVFKNIQWRPYSNNPNRSNFEIRIKGLSFTLSEFMVTEVGLNDGIFEPYCGGLIPITFPITGKNKFNGLLSNSNINSNGVIEGTNENRITSSFVPIAPGTYTISNYENYPVAVYVYSSTNLEDYLLNESLIYWNNTPFTFTINNGKYVCFKWKKPDESKITTSDISLILLELNTSATIYEPYSSDNTIYGGYIDIAKGELIATYYKYTFNGTETNWSLDGSSDSYRRTFIDTINLGPVAKAKGKLYCNYCRTNNSNIWYGWLSSTGTLSSCHVLFRVPVTIDTVNKWKAYLIENPLEICYELNVPIHYPLPIRMIKTLLDRNNIWSNTNDITEVSYLIHDSNMIKTVKKEIIAGSQPHVETATDDITNFNTDMVAPIKDVKIYFSPVLEGEDDPSPENVRPITGWAGLEIHLTLKSLINLSELNFIDNTANINLSITNNTLSFSLKKVGNNFVNGAQTVDWIIPPALKGKEVYMGCTSVNLLTSNENHKSTIVCQFNDKDDKRITDPTVVSYLPNASNNTFARKVTIPENAVVAKLFFRIALNISTYNAAIGDSVTFNDFHIIYPADIYRYEEYNGNIIPITFPATKNLFNENYEGITSSLTYHSLYVGDENVTASTTTPQYTSPSDSTIKYSNIFVFPGQVTSGASTGLNDIFIDRTRTVTPIDGYITIAYRNSYGVDPIQYHTQIEKGNIATDYEPYGTIYGGYIDLINGKLVKEWERVSLKNKAWYNYSSFHWFAFNINKDPYTDVYCNCFTVYDATKPSASRPNECITSYHNGASYADKLYFWKTDGNFSSNDDFKNWMNSLEYDPYVIYKLKSPIEYPLTPQTLKTLKDTNNIWSNANGPVSITYWTH